MNSNDGALPLHRARVPLIYFACLMRHLTRANLLTRVVTPKNPLQDPEVMVVGIPTCKLHMHRKKRPQHPRSSKVQYINSNASSISQHELDSAPARRHQSAKEWALLQTSHRAQNRRQAIPRLGQRHPCSAAMSLLHMPADRSLAEMQTISVATSARDQRTAAASSAGSW